MCRPWAGSKGGGGPSTKSWIWACGTGYLYLVLGHIGTGKHRSWIRTETLSVLYYKSGLGVITKVVTSNFITKVVDFITKVVTYIYYKIITKVVSYYKSG